MSDITFIMLFFLQTFSYPPACCCYSLSLSTRERESSSSKQSRHVNTFFLYILSFAPFHSHLPSRTCNRALGGALRTHNLIQILNLPIQNSFFTLFSPKHYNSIEIGIGRERERHSLATCCAVKPLHCTPSLTITCRPERPSPPAINFQTLQTAACSGTLLVKPIAFRLTFLCCLFLPGPYRMA